MKSRVLRSSHPLTGAAAPVSGCELRENGGQQLLCRLKLTIPQLPLGYCANQPRGTEYRLYYFHDFAALLFGTISKAGTSHAGVIDSTFLQVDAANRGSSFCSLIPSLASNVLSIVPRSSGRPLVPEMRSGCYKLSSMKERTSRVREPLPCLLRRRDC